MFTVIGVNQKAKQKQKSTSQKKKKTDIHTSY